MPEWVDMPRSAAVTLLRKISHVASKCSLFSILACCAGVEWRGEGVMVRNKLLDAWDFQFECQSDSRELSPGADGRHTADMQHFGVPPYQLVFLFLVFTLKASHFRNLKIDFRYIFLQISKLHIPSFHMNQLACPTDIPSGADGCAKMHLEKWDSGARSKMGRAKGVNPHGTVISI